jgi:hypothetical protein
MSETATSKREIKSFEPWKDVSKFLAEQKAQGIQTTFTVNKALQLYMARFNRKRVAQ